MTASADSESSGQEVWGHYIKDGFRWTVWGLYSMDRTQPPITLALSRALSQDIIPGHCPRAAPNSGAILPRNSSMAAARNSSTQRSAKAQPTGRSGSRVDIFLSLSFLKTYINLMQFINRGLTEENTQLGISNSKLEIFHTIGQCCSICSVTTLWQHRDRIRDRIRDRTVIVKWQNFFLGPWPLSWL